MKKILFAGIAASALLVGPALAADMAVKAPRVAPPPAPVTSWTGCYINGGGGYGMWNQDNTVESDPGHVASTINDTNGGRGWFGTIGAGCDYQFNQNIVIGAFGDFDFMSLKGTLYVNDLAMVGDETERWAWGVGARVGWLVTPALLTYVNGGYTQTRFDQVNLVNISTGASENEYIAAHTYNGWFIGGGTEYNLNWIPGLFWRSEYRYASYRASDNSILNTSDGSLTGDAMHSTKFVQTIRSELVYRFNWH
jgi:outer membrane immunogenic protein